MFTNIKEYYFPKTIIQAVKKMYSLIEDETDSSLPKAVYSTGAIHLIYKKLIGASCVIDISRLPLNYIFAKGNKIHIGATVSLQQLIDNPIIARVANGIICASALAWSSKLKRQLTTLEDILSNNVFKAEIVTVLTALDAQLKVQGIKKKRTISLSTLFYDSEDNPEKPAGYELITELIIPPQKPNLKAIFTRFSVIESDISIMNIACLLSMKKNKCTFARIVFGGGFQHPIRARFLEEELLGKEITEELINSLSYKVAETLPEPISDFRATAEYRRKISNVLCRRALLTLAKTN